MFALYDLFTQCLLLSGDKPEQRAGSLLPPSRQPVETKHQMRSHIPTSIIIAYVHSSDVELVLCVVALNSESLYVCAFVCVRSDIHLPIAIISPRHLPVCCGSRCWSDKQVGRGQECPDTQRNHPPTFSKWYSQITNQRADRTFNYTAETKYLRATPCRLCGVWIQSFICEVR